ncbi:hypothetical protein ACWGLE_35040 [Streptomyces sp. NPDC055897]
MPKTPAVGCVETPAPRRLHTPEATVVIVVVLMGGILLLAGFPAVTVVQLLGSTGLIAGVTVTLTRTGVGRGAWTLVRRLSAVAPAV